LHGDSHYSGLIYLKSEELGDAAKCREVCANKAEKQSIKQKASVCDEQQTECWPLKYFSEPGVTDAFTALVHCMDDCYEAIGQDIIAYYLHRDSHYSRRMYFKSEELGDAAKCREVCANKGTHTIMRQVSVYDEQKTEYWPLKYFHAPGETDAFTAMIECLDGCYVATNQDNVAYYVDRDPQYSGRMYFKPEELGDAAECREICANKAGDLIEEATAKFCMAYAKNCISYKYFGRWGYDENFELHLWCINACNFVDKGKLIYCLII
uniref:Apple domain-containing protein n=1 Tax=Schistocephalus solidus TaxID=70667 RepID=A0A183TQG1_SCHSO